MFFGVAGPLACDGLMNFLFSQAKFGGAEEKQLQRRTDIQRKEMKVCRSPRGASEKLRAERDNSRKLVVDPYGVFEGTSLSDELEAQGVVSLLIIAPNPCTHLPGRSHMRLYLLVLILTPLSLSSDLSIQVLSSRIMFVGCTLTAGLMGFVIILPAMKLMFKMLAETMRMSGDSADGRILELHGKLRVEIREIRNN